MDKTGQNRTRQDKKGRDKAGQDNELDTRKYTKLSRSPIHKMKETMAVVEIEDFVNG